jgi:DNA-binding transcriptional MerR regulator
MLTIGQLAAYAGVTVRAVRHYHQIGLLPEPERDASGYRRYGATAVVSLIKIRTLANAGVPLSQIGQMLEADASTFAEAVQRIDSHLRDEIERLETSRKQIAQLTAGDSLALPPEVISYLDRLREIGASERMVEGERDGWILVAARWPDRIREFIPEKLAQLDDPQLVRLYRVLSEIFESDAGDDPRLEEAADIMAGLAEQAYTSGEINLGEVAHDDLPFDLLDALAVESDPRAERLLDLMRERGWASWTGPDWSGWLSRPTNLRASFHTCIASRTRRRSHFSGLPPRPPVLPAAGSSGASSAHCPSVIVEPG